MLTHRYPFLNEHIRVLIYNGDWDACVPYTDNEAWTVCVRVAVCVWRVRVHVRVGVGVGGCARV